MAVTEKRCEVVYCSMYGLKVTTDKTDCLACGAELKKTFSLDNYLGEGLFK